jgi:large subunit ribosomal protein L25
MSVANFELEAVARGDLGKGASRRLRREDMVLGVVYGGHEAAKPITLEQRKVKKALENDAIYSHILGLTIDGKKEQVVLRDLQRHPYKPVIMHMDFLRVKATDMINMRIPLHFHGEDKCIGVEKGGIVNHNLIDVEIRCQVGKLPEHIDIDVSNLDLDQSIHLSQLSIPAGAEIVMLTQGHHDLPVVSVHMPRQSKVDAQEEAAEAALAAEASAESAAATATGSAKTEAKGGDTKPAEAKGGAKPEGKSDGKK